MSAPRIVAAAFIASLVSASLLAQNPQPAPPSATAAAAGACAHTWVGREAEFEAFLKTAKIAGLKDVPVGVTRPSRAYLAPGGLAESMAWKQITPGIKNGFYESYRSEIAAYELDKLLGLSMIPPTVEREIEGKVGAAVLWASPTRSFQNLGGVPGQAGVAGPPPAQLATWTRQVVRAKMFDNLIANKDPNLGNWLVDADWHLLLIDHSRSFTTMKSMVHKMDNIDGPLWEKFKALDEASLGAAVGQWVGKSELRAILDRRDRMQQDIAKLIKDRGESVIFR